LLNILLQQWELAGTLLSVSHSPYFEHEGIIGVKALPHRVVKRKAGMIVHGFENPVTYYLNNSKLQLICIDLFK
jgi:hypothetical protein